MHKFDLIKQKNEVLPQPNRYNWIGAMLIAGNTLYFTWKFSLLKLVEYDNSDFPAKPYNRPRWKQKAFENVNFKGHGLENYS